MATSAGRIALNGSPIYQRPHKHTLAITPRDNLVRPTDLRYTFLKYGIKPECLEKILLVHTYKNIQLSFLSVKLTKDFDI